MLREAIYKPKRGGRYGLLQSTKRSLFNGAEIVSDTGINTNLVDFMLTENLHLQRVLTKFISNQLIEQQKNYGKQFLGTC